MANKKRKRALEMYSHEEMEAVEAHINNYFGPVSYFMHEIVSTDIHVDICVIPPNEEHPYYTLSTMGMGAHRMKVPQELRCYQLERAELVIALPASWKLDEKSLYDDNWYWPVRLLKGLARLPIECNTWLAYGHTTDNQEPYAPCTQLCGTMILAPQYVEEDALYMQLPNGENVNFYQVVPIYKEEMDYALEHGFDELFQKLKGKGTSIIVNNHRRNCMK